MKKILIASVLVISAFAFRRMDILSQLGISERDAQLNILHSFEKSRLYIPTALLKKRAGFNNLVFLSRKQMIAELGQYVKGYVSSDEFRKEYESYRSAQLPFTPAKPGDGLKRIEDENRKQLAKAEERLRLARPEDKAMYEKEVAFWKKQVAPYENHSSKEYAAQEKNAQALSDLFAMANKNKKQNFENNFPADVQDMIRLRLEAFLEMSATVDFQAALKKDEYLDKMFFVNPQYERKPNEWKLCYRLGKETTETVREFAKEWLQELKQK